jgi:plasmid stabilization system protein ParE
VKLVWSLQAKADLQAIHDHIATYNPKAARAVIGRIRTAAQQLQTFPELGTPLRDQPVYRLIEGRFGYRIIYERERPKGVLRILYVIHPRQNWPA